MVMGISDKEIMDIMYSDYDRFNDYALIERLLNLWTSKKIDLDTILSIYPKFIDSCRDNHTLVIKKFKYKKVYRENYFKEIFKSENPMNVYHIFKIFQWECSVNFSSEFELFILEYLIEEIYKKNPTITFNDNFLFMCDFNLLNKANESGIELGYLLEDNHVNIRLSYVTLKRLNDVIKPLVFFDSMSEFIENNKYLYLDIKENNYDISNCEIYIDYLYNNLENHLLSNIKSFMIIFERYNAHLATSVKYLFKLIELKYSEEDFLNKSGEKMRGFYHTFYR